MLPLAVIVVVCPSDLWNYLDGMNKWLNTLSKTFTFRLLNCHYRRSLPLCQNFSLKKSLTHNQVRFFKMSDLDNLPPVDPKTGEVIINPLKEDGSPKTPKEIEKEKKKAENC